MTRAVDTGASEEGSDEGDRCCNIDEATFGSTGKVSQRHCNVGAVRGNLHHPYEHLDSVVYSSCK